MDDDRQLSLGETIRDALSEYISRALGGGYVTAFHVVADYVDSEGNESWLTGDAPDQTLSRTLGLLEWSRLAYRRAADDYLTGVGDDDL